MGRIALFLAVSPIHARMHVCLGRGLLLVANSDSNLPCEQEAVSRRWAYQPVSRPQEGRLESPSRWLTSVPGNCAASECRARHRGQPRPCPILALLGIYPVRMPIQGVNTKVQYFVWSAHAPGVAQMRSRAPWASGNCQSWKPRWFDKHERGVLLDEPSSGPRGM